MTTDELLVLCKKEPGLPVYIDTGSAIVPVAAADIDIFDRDEGWVLVVTVAEQDERGQQ